MLAGLAMIAAATVLDRLGSNGSVFDADDLFPDTGPAHEDTPAEKSHARFQMLKKPDAVTIGGRRFVTVRDLGGREKLLWDEGATGRAEDTLYYAVEEPYGSGEIVVSKASKRGDYRAVGKPVVRGHAV